MTINAIMGQDKLLNSRAKQRLENPLSIAISFMRSPNAARLFGCAVDRSVVRGHVKVSGRSVSLNDI